MARPRPACVNCQREMLPEKTGAIVETTANEQPYELWSGDMYGCPKCGARVVTNYAAAAITKATERTFPQAYEAYKGGDRVVVVLP